jgi:malto-oligosyltrehalose trehalohydrolase
MPFGAEALPDGQTRFRLWAPSAHSVELVIDGGNGPQGITMPAQSNGWREVVTAALPGTRYRYRIDGRLDVPDPASRYNPEDVHGVSVVVDPAAYDWPDEGWRGRPWSEAVIYELHVGTFSPEGTFAGVERKLDYLADLGVTAIELMPLAEFPGKRNWGYDGALLYAPDSSYGSPDDLKRLVAAAHARGLMMLLDVVYNHFGPEGNYLNAYAQQFFTERHKTAWGAAINYDGRDSQGVRDFFIHNALYWLEEYHFDGLRFDAVHAIVDDSEPHVLVELAQRVREGPGRDRHVHLVLENDDNQSRYLTYDGDSPRAYSAQWNDDQHHAFHVLLTGEKEGYYDDYADEPAKRLGRTFAEGYAYQGDESQFRDGAVRGESSVALPPQAFVNFLQNHDQIGNRALGDRLVALAPRGRLRAATAAWLLAPAVPMLFMGEEFAAATPFLFFCDFGRELAELVAKGRRREFSGFAQFAGAPENVIPDPNDPDTFEQSKLDWESVERGDHASWLELYRTLLALRRDHIVPRLTGIGGRSGRYRAFGHAALAVTWKMGDGSTLELRLNLSDENVRADARPKGTLLYSEPAWAGDAFSAGELPANASAVYLQRA